MKFYAIDYHKDHFIVSVSSVNEDGYITYALSAYNDRLGNICTTNTENQIIGLSINKTDEIMTRSLRIIAVTNMNEYYIFVYDMITNQFHINPLRNDSRCSSDFSDLGAICWSGDRSVGIGCHNSTFLFAEFELGKKNEILITDTTIPNGQGKQISFVNEYGPGIFLGVNKGSLYYFKEGKSPGLIFNTRDNSKITSFQYDAPSQLAAVFTGDPKNASGRSVNCFWFRVNRTRDLIHRVTHFHLNPITHFLAPTTFSAIPVVMPGKTSNHSLLAFYVSIYGKVVAVINGKHGFFEIDDIGNKGRPINCTIIKKSSINEKENFSISVCLHYRNHINTKIIAINVKNFEIFEKN
uniref:Lactonase family protein n=1 Tax=Rhabditophanes sp. KR3021 TaxID=114890 RepID=A0AC35U1C5_9BILA